MRSAQKRLALCFLMTLMASSVAWAAGPGGEVRANNPALAPALAPVETTLEIDWEATRDLVFIGLPDHLQPGLSEVQVRVAEDHQPLFFERLTFDPSSTEPVSLSPESRGQVSPGSVQRALQVFAYQPEDLTWLLEQVRAKKAINIDILLNGESFFHGNLEELARVSDALRQDALQPLPAQSMLVDLREGDAQNAPQGYCEDDCEDDFDDCREDACYWDYDPWECEVGCEEEFWECMEFAEPCDPPPPPTCTPGTISTSTSTQIVGSQFAGQACFQDFFPGSSVLYFQYYLTYQVTTTELRRRADCTTYSVVTDVSYFNTFCYSWSGIPCSFGFGFPFCIF